MTDARYFAFKDGLTTIEETESRSLFGLDLKTSLPASRTNSEGRALYDAEGLVSYSGEVSASNGTTVVTARRTATGLEVEFSSKGIRGNCTFDASAYDLTNLDLLVLDP